MRTRIIARWPLAIVVMSISGPRGTFRLRAAVDSGARNTVVEVDVLSRTGYSTADMTTDVLVATPTATTRMPSVAVESVSSLGLRRMDHTVVANTFPPGLGFQALIGLDFLRGHRFCIDIGAGVIDVDPSEGA